MLVKLNGELGVIVKMKTDYNKKKSNSHAYKSICWQQNKKKCVLKSERLTIFSILKDAFTLQANSYAQLMSLNSKQQLNGMIQ